MISVLLPIGGELRWLGPCVESIAEAATGLTVEVVAVINGKALDELTEVLKIFEEHPDLVVKIIESPATNLAEALNEGLNHCQYELVARIDADDLMYSNRLKKQLYFMNRHPRVGVLGTQHDLLDENSDILKSGERFPIRHRTIANRLMYRNAISHPSVIYRKRLVQEAGGYREESIPAEDYDLWTRLVDQTEFASLPESLTGRRVHPNQISSSRTETQLSATQRVRDQYRAKLNLKSEEILSLDALLKLRFVTVRRNSAEQIATRGIGVRVIAYAAKNLLVSTWLALLDQCVRGYLRIIGFRKERKQIDAK